MDTSDANYNNVSIQMIRLDNVKPEELLQLYQKALKATRFSLGGRLKKLKRRLFFH